MFSSFSWSAFRSATVCSASQTVWIMLLPISLCLWQTNFVSGVSVVPLLATTLGAVTPVMTGSCEAQAESASAAKAMSDMRMVIP